jgi:hypothetical protein
MERFDEFSSIEQAAMEQSPASETDVRHNFVNASSFIGDIVDGIADIAEGVGDIATNVANAAENVATEAIDAGKNVVDGVEAVTGIVAAAGGAIVDTVFTKQHAELLKSVNKECSVDELIDLRNSLMKANSKK